LQAYVSSLFFCGFPRYIFHVASNLKGAYAPP
jgi:hypothetical protein